MYGAPRSGAFAGFNAVINGDASVFQTVQDSGTNQENTYTVAAGSVIFPVAAGANAFTLAPDQWFLYCTWGGGNTNVDFGRTQDAPTLGTLGYSLSASGPGGAIVVGANDFLSIAQPMEGLNFLNLLYRPATLSFYVKSPISGQHYVTLIAGGNGYPGGGPTFIMPFTVFAAGAWEKKTIALDLGSGTGLGTNPANFLTTSRALTLHFVLLAGANLLTANTSAWLPAGTVIAGPGQQSVISGTATPFQVTEIAILPGGLSDFPFQPPQLTLQQCQRYLWSSRVPSGGGFKDVPLTYFCRVAGAFNESMIVTYPSVMCNDPVISCINAAGTAANWRNVTAGADSGVFTVDSVTPSFAVIVNPQAAGDNQGDEMNARILVDARL